MANFSGMTGCQKRYGELILSDPYDSLGVWGWGGTPLYKLCRYVPPQRVWFLSHFGLKTGIDFDHYVLKSGMIFEGTTGA